MAEVDKEATVLMKRFGARSNRSNWESHWQEIGDFVVPNKGNVTRKRTPGDKNMNAADGTLVSLLNLWRLVCMVC